MSKENIEYKKIYDLIVEYAKKDEKIEKLFTELNVELDKQEKFKASEKKYLEEINRLNFQVQSYKLILSHVTADAAQRAEERTLTEKIYCAVMKLIYTIKNIKLENVVRFDALNAEIEYKDLIRATTTQYKTIFENREKLEKRDIVQEFRKALSDKNAVAEDLQQLKAFEKTQIAKLQNKIEEQKFQRDELLNDISQYFSKLDSFIKELGGINNPDFLKEEKLHRIPDETPADTNIIVIPTVSSFFNDCSSTSLKTFPNVNVAFIEDAPLKKPQLPTAHKSTLNTLDELRRMLSKAKIPIPELEKSTEAKRNPIGVQAKQLQLMPLLTKSSDEKRNIKKVHFALRDKLSQANEATDTDSNHEKTVKSNEDNKKIQIIENILLKPAEIGQSSFSKIQSAMKSIDFSCAESESQGQSSLIKPTRQARESSDSSIEPKQLSNAKGDRKSPAAQEFWQQNSVPYNTTEAIKDFLFQTNQNKPNDNINTDEIFRLTEGMHSANMPNTGSLSPLEVEFSPPQQGSFGLHWLESDNDNKSYEL